jgi:hypothetical protein
MQHSLKEARVSQHLKKKDETFRIINEKPDLSIRLFPTGETLLRITRRSTDMKKLAAVLMVVGMFGAMPVLAADHAGMKMDTTESMRECAVQAETIQHKITRIQSNLNDGSRKYTPKELKKLNAQLADANKTLDSLVKQ